MRSRFVITTNRFWAMAVGLLMAMLLMAVPAFASEANDDSKIPVGPVATTDSYITGAATRAAGPAPEILGLASVEESGQFVDLTSYYDWSKPKYYLAASLYNSAPSPYLTNLAVGATSKTAIYNQSRSGAGVGPNAALGTSDKDEAIRALANVVIGNGNGVDTSAVAYNFSNYTGLVNTMDSIAAAADNADAADSTRTLRFGPASTIATNYKEYIFGTMGLIQEAIDNGTVSKRSVAVVTSYDKGSGTFTLLTTDASGGDGTASTNRYLETTANTGISGIDIATNYADEESTVTADELEESVSLILVGGQQSSKNYASIMEALEDADLIYKTYAVENNGSNGAMYGVVMNSVENAQNIGRVLGMLYPEVVSQQNWIAYYYQSFYHINEPEVGTVMNLAMDGVSCASAASTDTFEEASTWNVPAAGYANGSSQSKVQVSLDEGYAYFKQVTGR